jgi:hypothetical protein
MANLFQKFKIGGLATIIILFAFGFAQEILAAPTWTSNGVVPQSGGKAGGGALEFDGASYVDIGDVGNIQTVEFWLNNSNATDGILELINNSTYVSISSGAIAATGFTSASIYVNGIATSTLSSGWNHVIVTDTASVAAASFLIGEANGDYMSGIIDEVRVYNRALSIAEVRYHYNKGGPVAHWKFDEGSGSTAYDSTVRNNDGTIYGATYVTGKYNSALSFDGANDYVQATVTPKKTTYSLWIKPANSAWEHVVKIDSVYYVNTVQGNPTAFPIYVSGNTVQIGKTDDSTYFNGLIDDVRIYNYARTLEEIKLDYNAGFKAIF